MKENILCNENWKEWELPITQHNIDELVHWYKLTFAP